MALKLTQAISRTYYDWHPTVMHDLHESIALLVRVDGHRSVQSS